MMRLTLLIVIGAGWAIGQTKAGLIPPRQIDVAARKVERSWTAWQELRPEERLLEKAVGQALAIIDHSAALASQYVANKKAYYSLIASAFQQQAQALRREGDENIESQRNVREEQVDRLLDQEEAIRLRLSALSDNHDGRSSALRQAYQAELKVVQSLSTEARRHVDILTTELKTATEAAEHRRAAASALAAVTQALTQLSETIDLEGEDWAGYHDHLRMLIRKHFGRRTGVQREEPTLEDDLDAIVPRSNPRKKDRKR